jgi:integrase
LKKRVQHPAVMECHDREHPYYFFRYRDDEIQPDGSVKTSQKRHIIGPIAGLPQNRKLPKTFAKKEAESERDRFFADLNKAETRCEAAVVVKETPPGPEHIIFGNLAQHWRTKYVEGFAAGKPCIAKPTREVYINALEHHVLARWKDVRLGEIRAKDVLEWLQEECTSWHMMAQLRGVMSGIITKAVEWEILPETFGNPIQRVKLPKEWAVREQRILTEEQTAWVLANLDEEGNLLICETCLDTGTRISEVTGLMIKHVDLEKGTINIAQRNWRGDIDDPKTAKGQRILTLGNLLPRYKAWIEKLKIKGPNAWVFPQEDAPTKPRWDSGVRQVLKRAARACKPQGAPKEDLGLDFPGFGPHSLRRANITWRQEVGGSAIETSKIAGHADTKVTERYTFVGLKRQEELTRRVQAKRIKAAERAAKVVEMPKKESAA